MKITIFTITLVSNIYFECPSIKMCMKTWKTFQKFLKLNGIDSEIKIYTKNDDIVKYYLYKYGNRELSHISDLIRLDILSNNENYLYLDGDMYFNKQIFKFKKNLYKDSFDFTKSQIYTCLNMIYSGNDKSPIFKNLLEIDKKKDYIDCHLVNKYNEIYYPKITCNIKNTIFCFFSHIRAVEGMPFIISSESHDILYKAYKYVTNTELNYLNFNIVFLLIQDNNTMAIKELYKNKEFISCHRNIFKDIKKHIKVIELKSDKNIENKIKKFLFKK